MLRSLLTVAFAVAAFGSPVEAFTQPGAAKDSVTSNLIEIKGSGSGRGTSSGGGSHYTRGYTRKDGTYVAPHMQSNPNSSKYDNWSTKGNENPYTGKKGTVDPDAPKTK